MEKDMSRVAKAIYDWCVERDLWEDVIMYFNGKAWASWKAWDTDHRKIGKDIYEYDNKDPHDYFEYVVPGTLSMSYEGDLYDLLYDGLDSWRTHDSFMKMLNGLGYYFEFGNSWNLSLVEE